ncbi:OmpH family outer membrane protein [bacterium]|nr:OmpH family outer membrane protein [bacterium]
MKKSVKFLTVALAAIVMGTGINICSAAQNAKTEPAAVTAASPAFNIAIVDIPKVVSSSPQVAALKKEQEAKAKELVSFVEKARKDIAATTDTKKKQALEEKYNKELAAKKSAMDKTYAQKLADIDTTISKKIENIAKANGYNMVVAKGIVLFGGVDITDKVIGSLK